VIHLKIKLPSKKSREAALREGFDFGVKGLNYLVGILIKLGLGNRRILVRYSLQLRAYFLTSVQAGCGAQPAAFAAGNWGYLFVCKAAGP
jgi:hypothetical protein